MEEIHVFLDFSTGALLPVKLRREVAGRLVEQFKALAEKEGVSVHTSHLSHGLDTPASNTSVTHNWLATPAPQG